MAVKDLNMRQAVLAARFARDSMAEQGEARWFNPNYTIRWGGNHLILEDDEGAVVAGPIGELADLEIE